MQDIIKGTAYVLGHNIDTDQIIPAKHLVYSLSDPEESKKYGAYALSGLPDAVAGLPKGNIKFVAGAGDGGRTTLGGNLVGKIKGFGVVATLHRERHRHLR